MLYNGLVHKHKRRLLLWDSALAGIALAGLLAAISLLAAGCGPAWQAKQADFTVGDCPAVETASIAPPDGWQWQSEASPVIMRGPAGAWDSSDVLNPSVVFRDGLYYNLYSGFDGRQWHTGLATSSDGMRWEKFSGNPVLSPLAGTWEGDYIAANGALLHDGTQFLYWYQAGRPFHIGLARSADARSWQRKGEPVIGPGPQGAWDEAGVADPYVLRCGDTYYMYYLGQTRRGVQRLGVARSSDGVHWQKFMGNPVLGPGAPGSFDERGLGEPAVFRASAGFYMIYTGRNGAEERRLGAARSPDGVHWRRMALKSPIAGGQPWNRSVVCDPTVLAAGGRLWLWFGGGDVPSPDQGLHGQIGLATLSISGH